MMAPLSSELTTPCNIGGLDSALPLESGIPQLNANKINSKIQDSQKKDFKAQMLNNIQSPLTAFNIREKQYKRSLSGTYGKNYKKTEKGRKQPSCEHKPEALQEKKDMKELLADLNLGSSSAIPNSYLYQPESEAREWMQKRGKGNQIYYDKDQV